MKQYTRAVNEIKILIMFANKTLSCLNVDCNICPINVMNCFSDGHYLNKVERAKEKLKTYSEEEIFESLI